MFVVLVTLIALVASITAKPKYVASLSIVVNRVNQQITQDYQYDGYYALQASDLFSQTLLSWFLTPSVLVEFYQRAGLDAPLTSTTALTSRFRARKFAAQNIVVQFTEKSRADAEKLAQAISEVVKERSADLDRTATGEATFEVVPAQPVIVEQKPNVPFTTAMAFLASVLVSFAFVWAARYLKE